MLKQVFSAHFELVVTRCGPLENPKMLLKMGRFGDLKWMKNGSKPRFSKTDVGPFGMLNQVFLAHFELVVTHFGPWKNPKMPRKWDALGSKMGEKWVKNTFFQN